MLPEKRTAKIRLQVAIEFARDLQAQRDGDGARFDRMVDGRGKGIIKRDDAVRIIRSITTNPTVTGHWPVTCRHLQKWLKEVA